ncbi:septation protein SepH [Brachybacterium paraconglomeratum]|uniref:septation protein SepH n=1 Tax=Brachybacterium paraconglomeratum TaxID=173362 RepID=UPI0031EA725B
MRELELDGIHDDGEHLLLVDSDGERYTLRIDRALRAAVRSDRPALNMIQAADSAPVRPREIQAMLRSGRSAEDIADASEIPLERVRRYEGPVLAEREWTASRARTFPVGRGGPALQDVVAERLAAREATGSSAWDAWRRQDGTWTLELSFSAGGRTRQAHWVADIDNRSVSPVDDEARWISDEDAPSEPTRGRGRLQAVKSSVYDLEADGSLDGSPAAASRARTWNPRRTAADEPSSLDEHPSVIDDGELDALNARRGLRSVPRPDESPAVWSGLDEDSQPEPPAQDLGVASADEADLEALEEHSTERDHEADLGDSSEDDPATTAGPESADGQGQEEEDLTSTSEHVDEPEAEILYQDTVDLTPLPGFDAIGTATPDAPNEEPAERAGNTGKPARNAADSPAKSTKKPRPKSKRASMPSWDEIVFGSKQD